MTDNHQVYTEDELNDSGLRRTKYSEKLFVKNKLEQNSLLNGKMSPTETSEVYSHPTSPTVKPKENQVMQKEKSFSQQSPKLPHTPRIQKANSFVDVKPPSRARSLEHKNDMPTSPKKSGVQTKNHDTRIGTWNGRSKNTRKSILPGQNDSPFTRNSTGKYFTCFFLTNNQKSY